TIQEIEIIEMTEMTIALEVVIDPLIRYGDLLIAPPRLTIGMLTTSMELLLPLL
ncbi:36931_t:CDS:1, partial [Gigaspora margarita]